MLPDLVSNPGPLTYKSGALPIALRSPANMAGQISTSNTRLLDQRASFEPTELPGPNSDQVTRMPIQVTTRAQPLTF